MVLLFLAVIGAIIFIEYIRHPVSSPTVRQAVETLDNKALLPQEISRVSQTSSSDKQEPDELMSAPDGSYVIARPPAGWSVVSTTVEDTFKEMFGARNMPKQGLVGVSSILLLKFGSPHVWTPQPDRMRLNGRRIPVLISEPLNRQLAIMTLHQQQPPFFIDRSLCDNAVMALASLVQGGVVSISAMAPARLPQTNREVIVLEIGQQLENIFIDGREQDFVGVRTRLTAIRGDVYDYVLTAANLQIGRGSDREAAQFDKEMTRLFGSFRPVTIPDPSSKVRENRDRADKAFDEFLATKGRELLEAQLGVALARLESTDINTPAGIAKAVEVLRPFRTFDRMLPDGGEENERWAELEKAEQNEPQPLQALLLSVRAHQAGVKETQSHGPDQGGEG